MEFNSNSTFMYVVVSIVIAFVLLQSVVFFIKAWKRGKELGMDKVMLKNKQLRIYFVPDPDSPFYQSEVFQHLLSMVQSNIRNAVFKHVGTNMMLVINAVQGIQDVERMFRIMKLNQTSEAHTQLQ